MNLANIIKAGRLKKNLNQYELANKLNVAPATISYWEKGKKTPSGDVLIRLATILDIVQELFPNYKIEKLTPEQVYEEMPMEKIENFISNEIARLKDIQHGMEKSGDSQTAEQIKKLINSYEESQKKLQNKQVEQKTLDYIYRKIEEHDNFIKLLKSPEKMKSMVEQIEEENKANQK